MDTDGVGERGEAFLAPQINAHPRWLGPAVRSHPTSLSRCWVLVPRGPGPGEGGGRLTVGMRLKGRCKAPPRVRACPKWTPLLEGGRPCHTPEIWGQTGVDLEQPTPLPPASVLGAKG